MNILGIETGIGKHLGNPACLEWQGRVDARVVPSGWKDAETLDKIQSDYKIQVDPEFMQNLSKDSMLFREDEMVFVRSDD